MTQNKKSTRFYSNKQEKEVAKLINGRTQPNSGATTYFSGDVKSSGQGSWLIECKTCVTNKQSFSIKKQWLLDTKEEAKQQGKYNYGLAFSFGPNQPNYYIIDEQKFKEIVEIESNVK